MEVTADVRLASFNDALYRLAQATGKEFGVVVKANGRLLAINLAIMTQPWSGREGNFQSGSKGVLSYNGFEDRRLGEAAVRRDVGTVYRTINDIYEKIRGDSKDAAHGFWGAAKTGNFKRAMQIMKAFQLGHLNAPVGKFDRGGAHQRRRNKRGRVPGQRAEMIVTNPEAIGTYTRKIERRVGMAKGGFAGAANALGNMRGLPQWVTRHKGGGSASDMTSSTNNPHAVLRNSVPWVDQVLNNRGKTEALWMQQSKMEKHILHVVAKSARKAGLVVHGNEGEPVPA